MQFPLETRLNGCQIFYVSVFKNRIWTEFRFSAHHYSWVGYGQEYGLVPVFQKKIPPCYVLRQQKEGYVLGGGFIREAGVLTWYRSQSPVSLCFIVDSVVMEYLSRFT